MADLIQPSASPKLIALLPLSCLLFLLGTPPGFAQDTGSDRLPNAAKLAMRGKTGDIVKIETTAKGVSQIHLEELGFEASEEASVKANYTVQYLGSGPNGTLKVETRRTPAKQESIINGQRVTKTIPGSAALMVYKPNMMRVSVNRLSGSAGWTKTGKDAGAGGSNFTSLLDDSPFPGIYFPDKVLKPGDTWNTTLTPSSSNPYMKGLTISYHGTLIGFEMYQGFPCAHVEYIISYKGFLPPVKAQVSKQLPKGATAEVTGEVNGTEVDYYALDRGVPLDEVVKMTLSLNVAMNNKGNTINYGGSYEINQHSAVTAYPAYDPSLVPFVSSDSSK